MTVSKDIKAGDALCHQILCVLDDLLVGALEDAGAAGDLADEGQILHAVVLEKLCDGIVVNGAHEVIEAAVDSGLSAVKAACLVIGDDLEEGGLAGSLHCACQSLHLVLGKADILKAPELYLFNVLALLEHLCGILYGDIVMGQHYDNFRSHFQVSPLQKMMCLVIQPRCISLLGYLYFRAIFSQCKRRICTQKALQTLDLSSIFDFCAKHAFFQKNCVFSVRSFLQFN